VIARILIGTAARAVPFSVCRVPTRIHTDGISPSPIDVEEAVPPLHHHDIGCPILAFFARVGIRADGIRPSGGWLSLSGGLRPALEPSVPVAGGIQVSLRVLRRIADTLASNEKARLQGEQV
jgi:hypothetical protein